MVLSVRDGYTARQTALTDIVEYLPLLYGYARVYENVRVQEIGTRDGNSTLAFLAAAEVVGGHVWSVDIDPDVPHDPNGMAPYADSPLWTFTCGNSVDPAVVDAQPEQVDVLFNDSGHQYSLTKSELTAYVPRVRPGGVILVHDTRLTWDDYGVKRALNWYCGVNGLTWHDLPGQYGMAVIHVPA